MVVATDTWMEVLIDAVGVKNFEAVVTGFFATSTQ
jgi:hypothetical protein